MQPKLLVEHSLMSRGAGRPARSTGRVATGSGTGDRAQSPADQPKEMLKGLRTLRGGVTAARSLVPGAGSRLPLNPGRLKDTGDSYV